MVFAGHTDRMQFVTSYCDAKTREEINEDRMVRFQREYVE